jgi:hypothetical protein
MRESMMRAGIQLLFVLFYVWSAYATTQHRISYIIHKIHHSSSRTDDTTLESGCSQKIRYTQFREAKKAAVDFYVTLDIAPKHFVIYERQFSPRNISLKSQFDAVRSNPRAPPQI